MSRPRKLTMDFFCHDAKASADRKIRLLTRKHGNDGYATFFRCLESLCQERGMRLDLSDKETSELMAEDFNLRDIHHLYKIVQYCADIGLFDKQLWESERIVFSHGLYDRYSARLDDRKKSAERQRRSREAKALQAKKEELDRQVLHPKSHHCHDVVTRDNDVVTDLSRSCRSTDTNTEAEAEYKVQNTESKSDIEDVSFVLEPEQTDLGVAPSHGDLFEEFWKAYPRKLKKKQCKTKYLSLLDSGEMHSDILSRLEYDLSHDWADREAKYYPHPSTWLNGEDWRDSAWKEVVEQENDPLGHLQPWVKAIFEVIPQPDEWIRVLGLCGIEVEYMPPNDADDHFASGVMVDHSDGGKPFVYWSAFSREYPPDLVKASLMAKGLSIPQWISAGEKVLYTQEVS